VKTLFFILIAYLVYMILKGRFFRKNMGMGGGKKRDGGGHVHVGEETEKDPVCGSYVPVSSALRVRSGSEVVYFCSPECKEKYLECRGEGPKGD